MQHFVIILENNIVGAINHSKTLITLKKVSENSPSKLRVGNLWPAGRIRPAKQFHPVRVLLYSSGQRPFFMIEIHQQPRRNAVSFGHGCWIGCKIPNFLAKTSFFLIIAIKSV